MFIVAVIITEIFLKDILEHLPDFTEIDLFKDEICRTLEEYGTRVDDLKAEIDDLSASAESIEKELESVNNRGFGLSAGQRCEFCSNSGDFLFAKQFYIFPCGHGFHGDCLMKRSTEILPSASIIKKTKDLEDQIKSLSARAKDSDKRSMMQLEYLQNELDSYIAGDCALCGEAMIRAVGTSLLSQVTEEEIKAWKI